MSDIFLSYANDDLPRVQPLIEALERRGWSVWWDRGAILPHERYDQAIEKALEATPCVLVVWSQASIASDWVRAEANEGRQRRILVSVRIDEGVRLPLAFRQIQAANLVDWHGAELHAEFAKVVLAVTSLLGVPPQTPGHPPERLPKSSVSGDARQFTDGLGIEFIRIPAGEFRMGSMDGDDEERPVHTVHISRPCYLGKYPVTQGQWQAVMGNNPSHFVGDLARPVERVSWEDVQEFLRQVNVKEGGSLYRLPTEAEWEYAARAGTTTSYSFGDDASQLPEYAWYGDNSGGKTQPVGQRKSNPWGLHDMYGNVWEWVKDWYAAEYYKQFVGTPAVDPTGPAAGAYRVGRGGGWCSVAGRCRSASRDYGPPGSRNDDVGLRLLRTAS